jgi:hypothetical protein
VRRYLSQDVTGSVKVKIETGASVVSPVGSAHVQTDESPREKPVRKIVDLKAIKKQSGLFSSIGNEF